MSGASNATGAEEYPICESFEDCGLEQHLLRNVFAYGLRKPSSIQRAALLPIMDGRDTFVEGDSGTGKTTALVVGCVRHIDFSANDCQALILAPTRELSHGICSVCKSFCGSALKAHVLQETREDLEALCDGQHLLIGTPDRLCSVLDLGRLHTETLKNLKILILDELHELLALGFKDHIDGIFRLVPADVQVCASAQTEPQSLELVSQYMRNAFTIKMRTGRPSLQGILHFYLSIDEQRKVDALRELIEILPRRQTVVFCNTRRKVEFLKGQLANCDWNLFCIHSELLQQEREAMLQRFRSSTFAVLICTELVAKGVTVPFAQLVVNYDLPNNTDLYLHRMGCFGTLARTNRSVSFVAPQQADVMREIQAFYNIEFEELPDNTAELR